MIEFIYYYFPFIKSVVSYIQLGGPVLYLILTIAIVLWYLVVERILYLNYAYDEDVKEAIDQWNRRSDHVSWYARQIRVQLISEMRAKIMNNMKYIVACVNLAPLSGLLGTVTGMTGIFQTLAILGTTNAREMAHGVYQAIIPTMTGMVIAITGLLVSSWLKHRADQEIILLEDHLYIESSRKTIGAQT